MITKSVLIFVRVDEKGSVDVSPQEGWKDFTEAEWQHLLYLLEGYKEGLSK